jgi:hypothetical protein
MGRRSKQMPGGTRPAVDTRTVIRLGDLQKILGTDRQDLAMRFSLLLQEYDNREIVPIRQRLLFLEKPWPVRIVITLWRRTRWLAENAWIAIVWAWESVFPPKPIPEEERCDCGFERPHRLGDDGCQYVMGAKPQGEADEH